MPFHALSLIGRMATGPATSPSIRQVPANRSGGRKAARGRFIPAVTSLEERTLLSTTFTVTNSMNNGTGSLRWAIDQANLSTVPSTIVFSNDLF